MANVKIWVLCKKCLFTANLDFGFSNKLFTMRFPSSNIFYLRFEIFVLTLAKKIGPIIKLVRKSCVLNLETFEWFQNMKSLFKYTFSNLPQAFNFEVSENFQ